MMRILSSMFAAVRSSLHSLSLKQSTILFLTVVCTSVTILIGATIWEEYVNQLDESTTNTQNMARSLAQHADDIFKTADTSLLGLSERIAVDGTSQRQLERLQRLLMLRVQELPQLQSLSIWDEDGERITSSLATPPAYLNIKQRDYFQYHQHHAGTGPYIGKSFQSHSSGEWVIPLSRRMNDANGQFSGVIVASLSVRYFINYYSTFDIGKQGAIVLIMGNGTQLARYPVLRDSLGKDLSQGPLYRLYATGKDRGSSVIVSKQDGVERLNSYQRLPHYPMFVAAALSKHDILAGWRHLFIIRGLITFGIVLLFIILGRHLLQQIEMRMQAERQAEHAREALQSVNVILEKLAQQDGLTGLANRRKFDVEIEAALQRARRARAPLALILIDVDHFKKYNDLYGHVAGDECLRQVAHALRASEQRNDGLAARYGGEEFAIILPDTDLAGALALAENMRRAVLALDIAHVSNPCGVVTISAGVNVLTAPGAQDSVISFITHADQALYQAKQSGRSRVQPYQPAGPLRVD